MIRAIVLVGLGGGIGSILRYLTSILFAKYSQGGFPWGTLAVNVLGSLLIGLLMGFFSRGDLSQPNFRFLFVVGFCGGYTTFSAFSLESIDLFQSGNSTLALIYIAASVSLSLLAVWAGLALIKF